MEDDVRQTVPPDAVLAAQLAQCHSAVSGCFEFCGHRDVSVSQQLEVLNVASRLVRASVALATALDKSPREFTHRVIVERPAANQAPMLDVTPAWNLAHETAMATLAAGEPPPPVQKLKTTSTGK